MVLGRNLVELTPVCLPAAADLEARHERQSYVLFVAVSLSVRHVSDHIADIQIVDVVWEAGLESVHAVLPILLLVSVNATVLT